MDLINTVKDLVKFRTETGNKEEIYKCFEYCKNLFSKTDVNIEVFDVVEDAPVLLLSNTKDKNFDVLVLGHLDVVPAPDEMFEPRIEGQHMFGRGTLDMKSFAAVAFNSMMHVLDNDLDIKFGVLLSSDEEKGSKGTKAFLSAYPEMSANVVLDNDVGGHICTIINKCKNPVFIKLIAKGHAAHGSTPWEGIDANENLLNTISNLRQYYPYYCKTIGCPKNTWIDTMHVAIMNGGEVSNVISDYAEAVLDFRLTENSRVEDLEANLQECLEEGVEYKISSVSVPVVMDENDEYIQNYKSIAEEMLGEKIKFEQIGGATDAREFAVRDSIVIMHSGTGDGMHTLSEFVDVDSVKQLADIQIKFLESL